MNRAMATLIGSLSLAALALLSVYTLAHVGFCAGADGGVLGSCLSAAATEAMQSPLSLAGWPAATLGLAIAARVAPRRGKR